jgi:hypothetical protein
MTLRYHLLSAAAVMAPVALALMPLGCGGSGEQRNEPAATPTATPTPAATATATPASSPGGTTSTVRVQPTDISYLGAFRLPGGDDRPDTFAYGGNAMAAAPDRNSLFIMGHDRLPWGELPNGGRVAEVSIPTPAITSDVNALPQASMIQGFSDVVGNLFDGLDEIPRTALLYLNHTATGPRLHVAWGQHFQEEARLSHALFDPNLANPDPRGAWSIADTSLYAVNGYLFEIPAAWAEAHASGRVIATGRFRDGGWSGKGPALYAYAPWNSGGTLAARNASLTATPLLHYEDSHGNGDIRHLAMNDYQHADEWEGGAWLTTTGGKSAVVFVGTKGTGRKHWYGWMNPAGAEIPCIETAFVNEYTTCWQSDGAPCPSSDLTGCSNHTSERGWWSASFAATILFYDPADLARVASGAAASHEPQPYATLDIDRYLFHNPSGAELGGIGSGPQRRYRLGASTYDRERGRLYVLELFADGVKPVVHVFAIAS